MMWLSGVSSTNFWATALHKATTLSLKARQSTGNSWQREEPLSESPHVCYVTALMMNQSGEGTTIGQTVDKTLLQTAIMDSLDSQLALPSITTQLDPSQNRSVEMKATGRTALPSSEQKTWPKSSG
jgi:hypothetical protein